MPSPVNGSKSKQNFRIERIELQEGADVFEVIKELQKDPSIEYAEPVFIRRAFSSTESNNKKFAKSVAQSVYNPNDPFYQLEDQWGVDAIGIEEAWEKVSLEERNDIVIAILDSGVDLEHPDLKDNIIHGYDFVNDDNDPDDDCGHGTHIAGIAAAIIDNQIGIAGIAGGAKIMPVKVLDENGDGTTEEVIEGIIWAVDNGADIINLSLGSEAFSQLEYEAISYAIDNGVVVIAATGNESNHWINEDGIKNLFVEKFDNDSSTWIAEENLDSTVIEIVYGQGSEQLNLPDVGMYRIYADENDENDWIWSKTGYVTRKPEIPTVSLSPGTYTGSQTVTLSTETAGAEIYYTLDGSDPTTSSTLYESPITINESTTIKAISFKNGVTSAIGTYSYIINIPSNNNNLSSITLNNGTLNPTFNKNITSYTVNVSNSTSSINITAEVEDLKATMTINGEFQSSGEPKAINLQVGDNIITIVVTAEDGTTKTYTVTVTRASSEISNGGNLGENKEEDQIEVIKDDTGKTTVIVKVSEAKVEEEIESSDDPSVIIDARTDESAEKVEVNLTAGILKKA